MTTIHADELQPGVLVVIDGQHHQITHVDRLDGLAWPIAADDSGSAIALRHLLNDVQCDAA